jgi:hypothetical protein
MSERERGGSAAEGTGGAIIRTGWIANVVFGVTAVAAAIADDDAIVAVAIAVALVLFFLAIAAFVYAFAIAVARSTRGDNVAVANLFFLQGSAPRAVQQQFLWMFLVCVAITAATVVWEPFGVLVPILPVSLAGVWAARHGTFPPRPPTPTRRRV